MASPHSSDHEDDAAFEAAAAKDAFGLSSFTSSSKGKGSKESKASGSGSSKANDAGASARKALVTNPDVLTEVMLLLSALTWLHSLSASFSQNLVGPVKAINIPHYKAHRYPYEHQSIV